MLDDANLQVAISNQIQFKQMNALVYRVINADYFQSINSVKGSTKSEGRFHHRDDRLGTLYFGFSRDIALKEVQNSIRRALPPILEGESLPEEDDDALIVAAFRLKLTKIINLVDQNVLDILGTSHQEITGSWRLCNSKKRRAETQRLAKIAHAVGAEAIIYHSAVDYKEYNMVIFVSNLNDEVKAKLPRRFPRQKVADARDDKSIQTSKRRGR